MSAASPVVALVQARMGSSRLPGKVLRELGGQTVLEQVIARSRAIPGVDGVVVATSTLAGDDPLQELSTRRGWALFRGSESDVLDRFYRAAIEHRAAHVLRVTSDCPLLAIEEAGAVIARHLATGAAYTHGITVWGSGMPLGTGAEIMTFAALERSWREGHEPKHREHVDEYIGDHPELFPTERVDAPAELRRPELRLTLDTEDDLTLLRTIYDRLGANGELVALRDVVALLDREPGLLALNAHVVQR
jgi:spore coat polysaccharide biosynthesis protein SpsF